MERNGSRIECNHLGASCLMVMCLLGCGPQGTAQAPPGAGGPAESATTLAAAKPSDVSAVLAVAPELTPESAHMLLETAPGASADFVARASLLQATQGFNHLSTEELRDLGATFAKAYAHLETGERARLEAYLRQVRMGDAGRPEEEAHARSLFNTAVIALPAADRQRLQALYARAIAASLAANREAFQHASERALLAVNTPSPSLARSPATQYEQPPMSAAARPSPSPASSPSEAAEEAVKRGQAEVYKSRLASAESYVRDAEAKLKWAEEHWHFVNSHTNQTSPLDEARRKLASAKADLERARKRREDIEDEARRASIPPGWLR